MENNKMLDEVVTNGITTVTDSLLDSKDNKGTTLLIIGAGVVGLVGGWLGTVAWKKLKKRKNVIEVEAEVIEKDNNIH